MNDEMKEDDRTDPRVRRIQDVTAHGNIRIDIPCLSEILPGLWQGGCANGLILPPFITHLLSLYPRERYEVNHQLRSEMYVRMHDSTDQAMEQVPLLAAWVNQCREEGQVAVTCQAGLNRSGLVIATALILQGYSPDRAISLLREKRSPAVLCNPSFEAWLRSRPRAVLTPREAAALLKAEVRTVARWAAEGKLTDVRTPGGTHRYYQDEVSQLARERESGSQKEENRG